VYRALDLIELVMNKYFSCITSSWNLVIIYYRGEEIERGFTDLKSGSDLWPCPKTMRGLLPSFPPSSFQNFIVIKVYVYFR
jgi:hypothetical protein